MMGCHIKTVNSGPAATAAAAAAGLTAKRTVGVLSRQQVCKCHLWPSTLPETTPLGGDESLHTFVFSLFFILLLSLLFKVDPPCSKGLYSMALTMLCPYWRVRFRCRFIVNC